ncbi:MurR/RpiR family transcriptional regulator [Lactococcus allomyrinae]|uniref:MurR/RpiR family transcriptional regulator n=1 Tax=Lactococcus allomyrinae TaxID=2419773 RepID=A0A387BGS2_9LACT|nr:MurR/RpiR family transcriptional regulator [Lactococcus allomyrinae]AYG01828.1 MurR/RpiR family transcriptional regulator [Lactococcus allomyrinae]
MSFFGNVDFQKLTYTERIIYSYLRDNVDKIPYLHVRDVASEAHAGTSSVMRLVHKMGYNSYTEFKEYVTKKKQLEEVEPSASTQFSLDIFPENFEQRLGELAHRIIESDNIIFTGVGSSGLICDYAARRLAGVGINTFSFSDVTYPITSKLRNTTNTLVIALSISGETNEVIEVLNSLRPNKDVYISCITPKLSSTIAELSDFVLNYRVTERRINTHYDLTSQLPTVYLAERLTDLVYELSE